MKSLDSYLSGYHSSYTAFDKNKALSLYKPRDPFANKGNFGHALILAGSYGKMGAAILAAKACLSAGVGLLTSYFPSCGYGIMQTSVPEAMAITDKNEFHLTSFPGNTDMYQSAGLGPGIGTDNETVYMVRNFIKTFQHPLVLDADALNIISKSPELLSFLFTKQSSHRTQRNLIGCQVIVKTILQDLKKQRIWRGIIKSSLF